MSYKFTRATKNILSYVTILAIVLGSIPAFPNFAEAATLFSEPSVSITEDGGEYASGSIDASGYENLSLSFDFDAEKLDATDDSFTYGWRDGGGDNDLGTFVGLSGNDPLETDSVNVSLPVSAQVADLEIYIFVEADSGNASDQIEITNLVVSGDIASDPVVNTDTSETFATVQDAIDDTDTDAGDTIKLLQDVTTSAQITINKGIILDGNGNTIDADFTKTSNSNNSAIGVQSDNVTIQNIIVDGDNGTDLHGINVYVSTGITVTNVTSKNFRSGLVVNGSEVDVDNFTTSGNTWHGINVDLGSGVSGPAVLNISNTSSHGEDSPTTPHIFVDDTTKNITVNDLDDQYDYADFGDARAYTLKESNPEGTVGSEENPVENIDICHATASDSNPYDQENVDVESIVNGAGHGGSGGTHGGDIIPPFWYEDGEDVEFYEGKNWDTEGQETWEDDCGDDEEPVDNGPSYVDYEVSQCGETTFTATTNTEYDNLYLIVDDGDDVYTEALDGSITVGPYEDDRTISYRVFGGPERDWDLPLWNNYQDNNAINTYGGINGWAWVTAGTDDTNPFTTWYELGVEGCPSDEEPTQCIATATADLNETPSQGNVVDTITEFVIDGITYNNGDSFDMFVAGDADAGDGSVGDEPEVQIERTSDGFELYFYGNGSQDVMEFSGSFTLDNVDASGASITAGSEPLEFAGSWPDEINIDTVTGEVTFTLYTNTGNDSFVVSGLVKDCPEEPTQCVDQLDGDWADNVEEFNQGNTKNGAAVSANRSNEEDVLGEADWSTGLTDGFVSLGFGGSIVVSFDSYVPNVDGDDISIHEATNGIYPDETALIEVSQNGTDWYEVGTADNDGVSYFDFDGTGLAWIKYVRITDTSNTALHGGDADGFDLDAIDATETVCEEPEMPEICSVVVVSDDSNEVEETEGFAKILSFVHTAWTAVITDADWIWGDDPVETPEVEETQTFVKNFEWSGGIASAILDIASDNHYTVYLNDVEVASSTDDNNFQIGTQDQIDMSAYVVEGENELKIEVVNLAGSSNPQSNPAGLKYNLTITSDETGDSCMYAPEEVDPSLEITKPETEDQVLSGEYTFMAEYVDADDNYDNVQWAIRAGTCNAGTNTVAGNVDGFNTDFDWDGASFSSTIDMSGWDEDEYCFVVNPTEDGGTNFRETRWFTLEHPEPTQCLIVSDTNTIVVENNDYAVETWDDHSNWTHDILDAIWIWDTYEVEDPEATTTRTFKETFTVSGLEEAKFYIAADNTYTVYINGTSTYEQLNSNNYQTHDEYTDVADYLVEGENELVVVVTNIPKDGSSPKSNPAGALFKLKMEVSGDGGQCVSTTEPEDEPLTYTLDGYKWNDENGDGEWGDGENAIDGWTIYAQNGEVLSTTTDSNGYYYFEVEEDDWEVYEATSTNWTQTGIVITTDYEGDGYIDTDSCIFEIDTEESESLFGTLQCDFGNNENEEPVISVASVGGGGGNTSYGGTGYFGRGGGDTTIPNQRVLGASTDTCEQYLTETIMPGRNNNPSEVIRLQEFLNSFEGYNLEVTGVYDIATQNAVGNFQEKYSDNVLAPWGLDSRTLNVYYTTRKTVNEIYCEWAVEFPLSQTEQSEIDWFRSLGLAYRQSGGNGTATPTSNDANNSSGDKGQEGDQSDDNAETSNKSNKEDSNVNSQAANTISGNGEGGFFAGIWNWFKGLFSW